MRVVVRTRTLAARHSHTRPMNTLTQSRNAIRHLLNQHDPADAMATYYAFHHADGKTHLVTSPAEGDRAQGYVAVSRTGYDLFRPFLTMRLPLADFGLCRELMATALPAETAVIAQIPASHFPLMQALFHIESAQEMALYQLPTRELADGRFQPEISLMVTRTLHANGLPGFNIRNQAGDPVAAAAMNWQSPYFAELSINTKPGYRRQGWGRSVLAAMVEHVLENGRLPLYVAAEDNDASIALARKVGFVRNGATVVFFQGALRAF